MNSVCIINACVNDDADYEYVTENALHNTLQPYWKWADDADVNINFSAEYDKQGYNLMLIVVAKFDNEQDCKDFQVNHLGQFPHETMSNEGQKYYFV